VVLLGPGVQFRSRLPSMLMRAQLRHIDPLPEDFVLPDIFGLDRMMKAALPAHEKFSYISGGSMRSVRRADARSRSTAAFPWRGITRI